MGDQEAPEQALVHSLRSLLALSEAYPDLKADEQFLELQEELAITEDRIQAARRLFNGNVRDYNQRVESVPSNLIAALGGFRRARLLRARARRSATPSRRASRPDAMHPSERVRIVTETARAVLEDRLDAATGAQTLALQQEQIGHRLRADRIDVTQAEADAVALTLRRLAEQVSDHASVQADPEPSVEMARILGEIAQTLR